MLRVALLGCPVMLVFAVSCSGSDSASFKDGGPATGASAGTSSATSGAGGISSQAGNSAAAGSDTTAGKGSSAGSSSAGNNGNAGNNGTAGNANTAGNNGNAGSGGNGNTAGNQSTGGKAGSGGTGNAGAANAGGAGGAPGGAGGAGGDGGGALCPDISGDYTITNVDGGPNCSGVNKNAMQSIANTEVACRAHFVSLSANPGGATGVNGGAPLDQNGDFTGAMLIFNKTQRNPCSGVWDEGNERMTIKCGGQGDQCTVVMERN